MTVYSKMPQHATYSQPSDDNLALDHCQYSQGWHSNYSNISCNYGTVGCNILHHNDQYVCVAGNVMTGV